MNRRITIAGLFAVAAMPAALMAAPDESALARTAAADWLQKVDTSNYSGSWEAAASMFKAALSAQGWEKAAHAARAPLGSARKRVERSATTTNSLPGAPDGQYVVLQYGTAFENKAIATETVSVVKDRDGSWRVAGYFIR